MSPNSLNRGRTFLQSWRNGLRQSMDHGPSAPLAIVLPLGIQHFFVKVDDKHNTNPLSAGQHGGCRW